ncbi:hypothetical protein SAMN06265375_102234 [Muriicola jejuensis]|uniref:Uncharacterized protein n=1 Tax=Muriicola jejuensis TaxID=504488 RepID=A0A6P0UC05_9FLAO|nr:hypothetical protein [Muriicola jejuensis]NER10785.1 hypothetical protein [Muriicola jejuensis]SMP16255.1 hypothetical protein SAMN06265375_102234 [Muriicola jejuensis]
MKTLVTFFFFFLIGFAAQAQNDTAEVKVETAKKEIVTETAKENSVARLYRFKNSRIKKELSFKTEKSTSKLA